MDLSQTKKMQIIVINIFQNKIKQIKKKILIYYKIYLRKLRKERNYLKRNEQNIKNAESFTK